MTVCLRNHLVLGRVGTGRDGVPLVTRLVTLHVTPP